VYLQSAAGISAQGSPKLQDKATGKLDLVWRIETDIMEEWVLSYVEATKGEVINGVVNYVAHSRYQV
jgi:extracellular elastinolytic metalloproteinase